MGLGPDIGLTLHNISEAGALLVVSAALQPSEEVELQFDAPTFPKPMRVLANVVRAAPVPGNLYCVAVRFQKLLCYADFSRLT